MEAIDMKTIDDADQKHPGPKKKKQRIPQVRTAHGRHYISTEDFLTFPSTVREKMLPRFKVLHVTRFSQVWMVASLPEIGDIFEVEEF